MRNLLGALVLGAVLGLVVWKAGPGLLRDWSLRNDYAPVAADVGGDCRAYVVVVTYCDVTLTTASGVVEDTLFFVDFSTADYNVEVVASPNDPTQISTSLGLDRFWNRLATLAGLAGVFAFALFGGIGSVLRREQPAPT